MMRKLAIQDSFARSTFERDLEVVQETSASPNGTRPKPRTISQEFRGKGVLAFECQRQVLDERVEETIARFRFNSRDDLSQRRVLRWRHRVIDKLARSHNERIPSPKGRVE